MTPRAWSMIAIAVAAIAGAMIAVQRFEGSAPSIEVPEHLLVGRDGARVEIAAVDGGSGLRSLRAILRHAGGEVVLAEQEYAGGALLGGAASTGDEPLVVTLDPKALDLRSGEAFLRVEARDWSWRGGFEGNLARIEVPVTVDLKPPRIRVESGLTYVDRGGSALVVYSVDEETARDGVSVGDAFFPGMPFSQASGAGDGNGGRRVALFAVPADAPAQPRLRVVAVDAANNEATASWPVRVQEQSFPEASVTLPPSFLNAKVVELAGALEIDASDPVAAFQTINAEVRSENEATIRETLSERPTQRSWDGAFRQLPGSKVTSRFAERRTYFADGQRISEATHYGFDLASTAAATITASNHGQVIFAGELGIYGSCVLVDHGMGLTSLYAHLSRLDVASGDRVERGQTLGLSGATGLAGGDHLHFAMLVGKTYVDPMEWWDPKWIREHITVRLAAPAS